MRSDRYRQHKGVKFKVVKEIIDVGVGLCALRAAERCRLVRKCRNEDNSVSAVRTGLVGIPLLDFWEILRYKASPLPVCIDPRKFRNITKERYGYPVFFFFADAEHCFEARSGWSGEFIKRVVQTFVGKLKKRVRKRGAVQKEFSYRDDVEYNFVKPLQFSLRDW